MKFKSIICLALIMLLAFGSYSLAANPSRSATKVDDVYKPYVADEWIVSDTEEARGDQTTDQVLETDIKGVIACDDRDYLRVDILLNNPVTNNWQVFYAIKFEYSNLIEYYIYYPDINEMYYESEANGKIVEHKLLDLKTSKDQAGVTSSGDTKNVDVYLIIDKHTHISGESGKKYNLSTSFFSGYDTVKDEVEIADQTITVDLEFEM